MLPKVFLRYLRNRVKVILSDGDAQECTQIDSAVGSYFPNCKRLRCGWDLVNRGWDRCVGDYTAKHIGGEKGKERYLSIIQWLYTFMKPGTETEEEYFASKKLLLRYLNSSTTISLIGAPIV